MSYTVDDYLFLGLPASGKTTYFSVMARQLQNYANVTDGIDFLFLPSENGEEKTSDFIQDCIMRLKDQRWVMKTQDYSTAYRFRLDQEKNGLLWKSKHTHVINYHDYPGEAFEVAFGIANNSTNEMKAIAEKMKAEVRTAKGVFLIVDAELFFNGERNREFRTTLESMLWFIRVNNPAVKLAIVFNKLELFLPTKYSPKKIMAKMLADYPNAFSRLPANYAAFGVYSLGSVATEEDGIIIPPKELSPERIFEPIGWMFDISLPSEWEMNSTSWRVKSAVQKIRGCFVTTIRVLIWGIFIGFLLSAIIKSAFF